MPRKKRPDYGTVYSLRAQGEDREFIRALTKDGRKKPADILREALHLMRKAKEGRTAA